jgi:hypothetical protein
VKIIPQQQSGTVKYYGRDSHLRKLTVDPNCDQYVETMACLMKALQEKTLVADAVLRPLRERCMLQGLTLQPWCWASCTEFCEELQLDEHGYEVIYMPTAAEKQAWEARVAKAPQAPWRKTRTNPPSTAGKPASGPWSGKGRAAEQRALSSS